MSIFSKNQNPAVNESNANEQPESVEELIAIEQGETLSASNSEQVTRLESSVRQNVLSKPSIISEGFTFEGTITSDGVINIAGTVRGKIIAKSVLIDSSGQVDGELNSEQLVIKGQLKGTQ